MKTLLAPRSNLSIRATLPGSTPAGFNCITLKLVYCIGETKYRSFCAKKLLILYRAVHCGQFSKIMKKTRLIGVYALKCPASVRAGEAQWFGIAAAHAPANRRLWKLRSCTPLYAPRSRLLLGKAPGDDAIVGVTANSQLARLVGYGPINILVAGHMLLAQASSIEG